MSINDRHVLGQKPESSYPIAGAMGIPVGATRNQAFPDERAKPRSPPLLHRFGEHCIIRAAVTNAPLDSGAESGAEYGVREIFQPKISTEQNILC
jgi:hypothetical protein